jgi:hypothetical protein
MLSNTKFTMLWYKDGQIIPQNKKYEVILFRLFPFSVEWSWLEIK